MTKETEDFALLASKLQHGPDEMPLEDYLIIKTEYCKSKLVDMAVRHRIEPPSSDLNAKPLDSCEFDERPPPTLKLTNAQHQAQLLDTNLTDNPSELNHAYVMKLHIREAQ